jgi:hypothetical protein
MTFDINTIADICRPHNERLIAEGRAAKFERALRQIAESHIPDQPASSDVDELTWAKRHVARLRLIATKAMEAA